MLRLLPLALLSLAVPAAAQGERAQRPIAFRSAHELLLPSTGGRLTEVRTGGLRALSLPLDDAALSGPRSLAPEDVELLAAFVDPESAPLERGALEGTSEPTNRYAAVPGGIVLGSPAKLEGSLAGARLVLGPTRQLALRTADGRLLRLPEAPLRDLAACAAFALNARGTDVAISIAGSMVQPARELAGGNVGLVLRRADRAPHRHLPTTRTTKTVIVDREVRLREVDGLLLPEVDLELRFYERTDSLLIRGVSRRVGAMSFESTPQGLRATDSTAHGVERLARDLDPLTEVVTWVALFRREASEDPANAARILSGLGG